MIIVENLRKVYQQEEREVAALDGVDLEVPSGTIHGIIGRSGAGKSTLVRCLALLDRPTSGSIMIDDKDITRFSDKELREFRHRLGVVFQHANLLSSRTVAGNVELPLEITKMSKADRRAKAEELIELVGLGGMADTYPAQLSGGQRQRVGIARALAADPDVLLCDEPTSALDPNTTQEILELIRTIKERLNLTVLVITHEMDVVKHLCDSVSLLNAGRITESGPLAEVASRQGSDLSNALLALNASSAQLKEYLAEQQESSSAIALLDVLGAGLTGAEAPTTLVEGALPGSAATVLAGTVELLAQTRFTHQLIRIEAPTESISQDLLITRAADVLRGSGYQVIEVSK